MGKIYATLGLNKDNPIRLLSTGSSPELAEGSRSTLS
jgi:hypothetical protein